MQRWARGLTVALVLLAAGSVEAGTGDRRGGRAGVTRSAPAVRIEPVPARRAEVTARRGVVARPALNLPRRAAAPVLQRGPSRPIWRTMGPGARTAVAAARFGPRRALAQRAGTRFTAACFTCRGGGGVPRFVSVGWAQGLSPALGVQAADCPAGTRATLARGHDDVVRCVPL